MDDLAAFARLTEALRPWLGDLVIVGGWAHRLYRFHPRAHSPDYAPLRTLDADIAFSDLARLEGDIGEALKARGFRESFRGENRPPVIHYQLGEQSQGFYAEFLAPLIGRAERRDGSPDLTTRAAGITAQKLRWLDVLIMQPWSLDFDNTSALPLDAAARIRIANPVSFMAQKLLIRQRREANKQSQDVLYMHDTLDLFGPELPHLKGLWVDEIKPRLMPKTARDIIRLSREQFGEVSDVIREAARIPQDRQIAPEVLRAACAYGLNEIFGPG